MYYCVVVLCLLRVSDVLICVCIIPADIHAKSNVDVCVLSVVCASVYFWYDPFVFGSLYMSAA